MKLFDIFGYGGHSCHSEKLSENKNKISKIKKKIKKIKIKIKTKSKITMKWEKNENKVKKFHSGPELPQKLKFKEKIRKNKKIKRNYFFKKQFFSIANQNCHSDCTYDGMERSTCCTL